MMMFLVLKERLRSFYGKYAAAADGMVKFICCSVDDEP